MQNNCDKIKSMMREYLDKELDTPLNKEVEDHIIHCASCKQELLNMEKLSVFVRENLPEEEVPPVLLVNTWKAVENLEKTVSYFDFLFTKKGFSWSMAMYAVGLFVVLTGYFLSPVENVRNYNAQGKIQVKIVQTVEVNRVSNIEFGEF